MVLKAVESWGVILRPGENLMLICCHVLTCKTWKNWQRLYIGCMAARELKAMMFTDDVTADKSSRICEVYRVMLSAQIQPNGL